MDTGVIGAVASLTSATGNQSAATPAPRWQLGDWWEYEFEFPLAGHTGTARIVVVEEDGASWKVSTTDATVNLLAEFAHYPNLGRVQRSDLGQSIHGADIPFFQWPLAEGKTWVEPYRAGTGTWTVKAQPQHTARGPLEGFDISMRVDSGEAAEYGYAPEAGWFTKLEFGFPGVTNTKMRLRDWGNNHSTPVSVMTFDEHVHKPFPVVGPSTPPAAPSAPATDAQVTFNHGDGQDMLWGFFYGGAPGAYGATIRPRLPGQHEGVTRNANPSTAVPALVWGMIADAPAGAWETVASGATQAPGGFLFVEVLGYAETLRVPGASA